MSVRTAPSHDTSEAPAHPTRSHAGDRTRRWRRVVAAIATAAALLIVVPPVLHLTGAEEVRQLRGVTPGTVAVTPVAFSNDADDLDLAGQLFLPDAPGPHPAVSLINGSGPSRRSNSWYLTISAHLVDAGVAVLWPDKRGSGESEGDWRTAGFDALARDARASLDHLRSRADVDPDRVGVIGMSQGGRIASVLAAEDDRLAFAVSFVGGVLPAHASLRFEETNNLREMGFLPGIADVLARPSSWALVHVSQSDFWDAVGDFDPLPYWSRAGVPVLFQFGDADTNVDTAGSVARIRTMQRSDIRIEVYAGSGHALQQPPDQGDALIRPEALRDLVDFIDAQIAGL